tara:strand:- start:697 stop:1857 length:1161 start_codon:yes stop_codon:yes gene_type:complete
MIEIIYCVVSGMVAFSLVITLINWKFLKHLSDFGTIQLTAGYKPRISILVPARNEENGIMDCVRGLVSQTYYPLEILILDDRSTDNTVVKVESLASQDDRIRILEGADTPPGWIGKNWACDQLYRASEGELLIFIDADTVLSPEAVAVSVNELTRLEADLLTVMPGRGSKTMVERLMYSFMDWILFCWMPLKTSEIRGPGFLSTAFGQFMLFKRKSYEEIGGHYSIKDEPLDDFSLGRMAKRMGLRRLIFQASDWVSVLPYQNSADAFRGVSRSVFPAMNYSVTVFLGLCVMLCSIGFLPISTIILTTVGFRESEFTTLLSGVSLLMVAITWLATCLRFRHNLLLVLFHPVSILLMLSVAGHSLVNYVFRKSSWKDRRIVGQKIRF